MKHRRGYTLVEMMTVIAVLGAFMALIGTTITTLVQLDATARREIGLSQAMGVWELQLREDIHQASEVRLDGGLVKLRPDATHTVQWEATATQMVRQLWEADTIITEERWPLPQGYAASWQINHQMLQFSLLPNASAQPLDVARQVQVEVEIGRLHRSANKEEQP
jgi:prepilin-type N-terminal cleavage/methylation domain-containing protein